jgi:hypothetical protein
MISLERNDDELDETIRKETASEDQHSEIPLDEDGFKRFKGLVFVLREAEQKVIERYHDDIREGHPGDRFHDYRKFGSSESQVMLKKIFFFFFHCLYDG